MDAPRTAPRALCALALGALTVATSTLAWESRANAQALDEQRRIELARQLEQSTVSVIAGPSSGSGFVTGDERWIVTNSHVIRPGRRYGVQVRFSSGTTRPATVLLDSPSHDLAVLEVGGEVPARPLPLADSDRVSVGQTVLAFGSPFGLDGTLTLGIVSALRDVPPGSRIAGDAVPRVIQTDAPINPGNSGGPLVSSSGEVIGVNTAILSRTGGSHGIGFAVPSNHVRALLDEVRRRSRVAQATASEERATSGRPRAVAPGQAFLGIIGDNVRWGTNRGVRIDRVVPGSPAEAAGLAGFEDPPPDAIRRLGVPWTGHVIVALDGHPTRTMTDLQQILSGRRPGQRAVLTVVVPGVLRGRAVVTLGDAPSPDELPEQDE